MLALLLVAGQQGVAQQPRVIACTSPPPATAFYTLTPCRVLDTRNQGGAFTAEETRTVTVAGLCGIPAGAVSVSFNVTVTYVAVQGDLTAYPANEPAPNPPTSVISYRNADRASNAVLKLGSGQLKIRCNQASGVVHVILDVNGYFQ